MNLIEKIKTNQYIKQFELAPLRSKITFSSIMYAVSQVTGVNQLIFDVKSRKRELVEARQLFCYFSRKKTGKSLAQIGAEINRDHATVLFSIRAINNLVETDKRINTYVQLIEAML